MNRENDDENNIINMKLRDEYNSSPLLSEILSLDIFIDINFWTCFFVNFDILMTI